MHPILDRRLRTVLYTVGWVVIGLQLAGVLGLAGVRAPSDAVWFAVPLALAYSSACLSAWWVCRGLPLGRTPTPRLLATLAAAALVTSALWGAAGGAWSGVVDRAVGPALHPDARRLEMTILFVAGVPLYLLSAIVHYLLIAFESARVAERHALEAQVTARESELRALRAQLHPHFLFNSLNSVSALVTSDPESARDMCEGLGDFYRRTLALGARDLVPLADEIALVERYLAIERVRFGARLGVERAVSAEAARCAVPPLLLQPLVENAVKHGVSERLEGGVVRIEASLADGYLVVTVENPVDADADTARTRGEGMGLENVRRRLTALDRRHTRLDVERPEGRYRVRLVLPAVGPAGGAARAAGAA